MIRDKKNLVVYHGTAQKVQTPDLSRTRGQKDFGVGFYLTTDKPQASQFANAAKNNIPVESFVIELLQTDNLKNQLCLCSDRAIKKLKFLKATVVR